ncbi:MAG: helix-turn-helix transcriptional regulator [Xanthobacteraceae bacterium]
MASRRGGAAQTPGLRREEVAQICGVSTTWYTWIEQGATSRSSSGTLARLARGCACRARSRSAGLPASTTDRQGEAAEDIQRPLSSRASMPSPGPPTSSTYQLDRPAVEMQRQCTFWRLARRARAAQSAVHLPSSAGPICDWETRAHPVTAGVQGSHDHQHGRSGYASSSPT